MGLHQRTEVLHSPEPRDCGGFRYGTDDFQQQSCNIKTTMDTSIRVPWCGIVLVQTGAQQRTLPASHQSQHLPGGQGEGAANVTPRLCASTRGPGAAALHAPRVRGSPLDGMIRSLRQ